MAVVWWIALVLLAVVGVGLRFRLRGASRPERRTPGVAVAASPSLPAAVAKPPAIAHIQTPPTLAALQLVAAESLPEDRRAALTSALRQLPQPPRALHLLSSPEFIAAASSAELARLVTGEPHVAARVLASVNSAFYGLHRPVDGLGQAITFLGLNCVRSISLKCMLDASFAAGDPVTAERLASVWQGSLVASELCSRLSQKLHLPDHGALVCHIVLSFIGHLAVATLDTDQPSDHPLRSSLFERTVHAQQQVGLSAGELGALLMQQWELPVAIVDAVRAVDQVLLTPAAAGDPRAALCYLCARLGERIASGDIDLAQYDPLDDDGLDFFHLRGYFSDALLERARPALRSPELLHAMQAFQARV